MVKKKNRSNSRKKKGTQVSASTESLPSNLHPSISRENLANEQMFEDGATEFLRKILIKSIQGPTNMADAFLVSQWIPDEDNKLYTACELGETSIVASLLDANKANVNMRGKDGSTPLIIASQRGHHGVTKLLIRHGKAEVNCQWVGNTSVTPLIIWCEKGDIAIVKLLLRRGAAVNLASEHGVTPIFAASRCNRADLLSVLIEAGADCDRKQVDGGTPILIAAEKGHLSVLESLYRYGGDLNARLLRTTGSTCMTLAAQNGHATIIQKLLEWNCPANVVDYEGSSPLFLAAARGHERAIKVLFEACPAIVFHEDKNNCFNPLEAALGSGNAEGFSLLLSMTLLYFSSSSYAVGNIAGQLMPNILDNMDRAKNKREKISYSDLLGIDKVASVIISKNAGPKAMDKNDHFIPLSLADPCDTTLRLNGNVLFKKKQFKRAIMFYEKAIALNPNCVLASSNAAEGFLHLKEYASAHSFALRALKLNSAHKKTWFRYAKSLAGLNRAAEAYVWIADMADGNAEVGLGDQQLLFQAASTLSPFCYEMNPNIIIQRHTENQYRVVTTKPIASGTVLSKELAVVPWTCKLLDSEEIMKSLFEDMTPEQVTSLNGIYPRSYQQIPGNTKNLSTAKDKVEQLQRSKCDDFSPGQDNQEFFRMLACAILCSFDHGIHHFSSFYNHSCAPNCEVRSMHNLEVVANCDIATGEELCITYRTPNTLDMHVVARQTKLEEGWGYRCFCARCTVELEDCGASTTDLQELEQKHGKESFIKFYSALETAVVDFSFPPSLNMSGSFPLFYGWQDIPWKRACVLNHEFGLLCQKVTSMSMRAGMTVISLQDHGNAMRDVVLKYHSDLISLEEAGAILCLTQLLEQKQAYLSKTSAILVPYYQMLERLIDLFLSAGVMSSVSGFQTEEQLQRQKKDLRIVLKSAKAHSFYEYPTYSRD